jgi:hypothetical protein
MNSGMISTGAPIAPVVSEGLSIKIKNSYNKFNNSKEKKDKNGNDNIK